MNIDIVTTASTNYIMTPIELDMVSITTSENFHQVNNPIIYNSKSVENTYYTNFSKNILSKPAQIVVNIPKFTYGDFSKTGSSAVFDFDKYKLFDLKTVAKQYKLQVSGNKPVIINRIRTHFQQITASIILQRVFRGHIVRYSYKLRGPAFNNRKLCVNETEFYTLDPIADIPDDAFFSFADTRNYVYGFDICSIISLITKSEKPVNPYNREELPYNATVALHKLYNITKILSPEMWDVYYVQTAGQPNNKIFTPSTRSINNVHEYRNSTDFSNTSITHINNIFQTLNARPATTNTSVSEPISQSQTTQIMTRRQIITRQSELNRTLEAIRSRPIDTRIIELFMEINLLGNYAECRWFTNLNRLCLARYYQFYYDWWYLRSRLNNETRNKICILDDPFSDVNLLYVYPTTTLEDFREACLRLMENMVYGTLDVEYRKLGALHLLSVLTVVSEDARQSMPWLYESLM